MAPVGPVRFLGGSLTETLSPLGKGGHAARELTGNFRDGGK